MARSGTTGARVAATDEWRAPEGRLPAGGAHAWLPGTNATPCGLPLARARLVRFAGVAWADTDPATGGAADRIASRCPRCAAAVSPRSRNRRPWQRTDPRP